MSSHSLVVWLGVTGIAVGAFAFVIVAVRSFFEGDDD